MRILSETSRIPSRSFAAVPLIAFCVLALSASASAASTGVLAWGEGVRGQLGDAATQRSDVPMGVSGLSGVTAVSGGADFSLALLRNGTVMAWGENGFGELGDGGSGGGSDVPVAVSDLSEVTQVAAGGNHALALLRNGTVEAWGYDAFGQLGYSGEGFEQDLRCRMPKRPPLEASRKPAQR